MELEKPKQGRNSSFRWALARAFGLEYAKQAVLILVEVSLTLFCLVFSVIFTLQSFKVVQVLLSPMVCHWGADKQQDGW